MIILTDSQDIVENKQIKSEEITLGTNKPFTRKAHILDKLKDENKVVFIDETSNKIEQVVRNYIDLYYLLFLKNAFSSWVNCGQDLNYMCDRTGGLITYHFNHNLSMNNKKSLMHLPFWKQCSYYSKDVVTPILEHTYETTIKSAYLGISCVDYLDDNDIIYCLTVYPGHHSDNKSYGGYCFINNLSVCVKHMLKTEKYKKVAVLDLDYHHGDGTESIFRDNPNVLTVSIHISPIYDYPSITGFELDNDSVSNIPLEPLTDIVEYLNSMYTAFDKINEFGADILVVALGFDTLKDDPDCSMLGGFGLEPEDFEFIGETIKDRWDKKIVVFQEGGYNLEKVGDAAQNFFKKLI